MAQSLKAYLERVRAKLEEVEPLTFSVSLWVDWRAPTRLVLKGVVTFIDGSKLYFLEYVSAEEDSLVRIVYRFHYVGPDGRLVFRYDNAPHHPEVPTHPHHKHLADGRVVPSAEKSLPEVLEEVKTLIVRRLSERG